MGAFTMIRCDNPACSSQEVPEEGRRKNADPWRKLPLAPYGWCDVDLYMMGCGPHVHVFACCVECVAPAIIEAVKQDPT